MEEEKMQIRRGALDQTARPQKGKKKNGKNRCALLKGNRGTLGKRGTWRAKV